MQHHEPQAAGEHGDPMPPLEALTSAAPATAPGWAQRIVERYDIDEYVEFATADIHSDHGFDDGDLLVGHANALRAEYGGAHHLHDFMSSHVLLWYVWHHIVAPQDPMVTGVPVGFFTTLHNPVCAIVDGTPSTATISVPASDIIDLGARLFGWHSNGWCSMFSLVYHTVHLALWRDTFDHVNGLAASWEDWQLALAAELAGARIRDGSNTHDRCDLDERRQWRAEVIAAALAETALIAAATAERDDPGTVRP